MVFVDVFDTFEESPIEPHVVGMLREDGTHFLCQGIEFIIGFGTHHTGEHAVDAAQGVVISIALLVVHPDDGVLESRFCGVVDQFFDGLVIPSDSLHEGFFVMFGFDEMKGNGLMGRMVFLEKGIVMRVDFSRRMLIRIHISL